MLNVINSLALFAAINTSCDFPVGQNYRDFLIKIAQHFHKDIPKQRMLELKAHLTRYEFNNPDYELSIEQFFYLASFFNDGHNLKSISYKEIRIPINSDADLMDDDQSNDDLANMLSDKFGLIAEVDEGIESSSIYIDHRITIKNSSSDPEALANRLILAQSDEERADVIIDKMFDSAQAFNNKVQFDSIISIVQKKISQMKATSNG